MSDPRVRLMTFVTNFSGLGPGHTAVAVDSTVYTFEDVGGGWLQPGSGWKKLDFTTYVKANEHRPLLLQTLSHVVADDIPEYVDMSIAKDDDYVGSGVCSTQVSRAINYALPAKIIFEPKGVDTPYGVFYCARRLQLVTKEEYFWPGRSKLSNKVWTNIVTKLQEDYPSVIDKMNVSP